MQILNRINLAQQTASISILSSNIIFKFLNENFQKKKQ